MQENETDDLFGLVENTRKKWVAREEKRELNASQKKKDVLGLYTVSVTAEEALLRVLRLEQDGQLDIELLKSGNEYPTLFTRLPIFIPSQRRTQIESMDVNTGVSFDCAFGKGVRKGPPLNTFDEDVLMALIRLRQRRLKGPQTFLPVSENKGDEHSEVDHLIVRTRDILNFLDLSTAGVNYERVVTSVKNLAATTIELEKRLVERYFGEFTKGRSLRLLDLGWCLGDEEGVFEIQFHPLVTSWLVREYTFVNWNIRSQLSSSIAKTVHRYLSSQGKQHNTELGRLAKVVGYMGTPKNMRGKFSLALGELQDTDYLKAWEITGTGRAEPFVVKIWR